MPAQAPPRRPEETAREVAKLALDDSVEITLLMALMQGQNTGGVNEGLNEAGAGAAAKVARNALTARLVMLIARAYARPKYGDLHLHVAACALKDGTARQIFMNTNGAEKLTAFETQWSKCRGDHRLPAIKDFRDNALPVGVSSPLSGKIHHGFMALSGGYRTWAC